MNVDHHYGDDDIAPNNIVEGTRTSMILPASSGNRMLCSLVRIDQIKK
jgi:hypothetical protein